MLDENELLFNELYEKTKDCGRVQFINLLMEKERERQELKKKLDELQMLYNNMFKCHCNRVQVETLLSQQKEFIKWLEKEIKTTQDRLNKYNEKVKNREETDIEYYESIIDERIFDVYEKQLSKYKEIIGGSE